MRGPRLVFGRRFLWLALVALLLGCQTPPPSGAEPGSEAVEVQAVLDRYMDALNALDLEGHIGTYHFPHYRHAHGQIVVWQDQAEVLSLFTARGASRRAGLRAVLEPDWHRSEWTRREIVQSGPEKVHVATTFVRLREDGSEIKRFDSLYVLTLEEDRQGVRRWGIRGRSSFAP